jgi:hypothetical protein
MNLKKAKKEETTSASSSSTAPVTAIAKPNAFARFFSRLHSSLKNSSKETKQTLAYIGQRILLMAITFIAIFFICFILVRLLPVNVDSGMKDPEIFYLNMVAQGHPGLPAALEFFGQFIHAGQRRPLGLFL